jgi:hypothetical protein
MQVSLTFQLKVILEIEKIAAELETVNNSNEITPEFKFNAEDHPTLVRFERCFIDLRQILRRDEQKSPWMEPSIPKQMFSPTDTPINSPERGDQHGSSPASTISHRSAKAEHHTQTFANNTVSAAHLSLERHLTNEIAWFNGKMEALPLYSILMMSLILSSEQTMQIQLGSTKVTAKSDGGISFYPTSSSLPLYPIFCIEVQFSCFVNSHRIQAKRKKSRFRDSETANQMHAAQIYAEMLGQVCHRRQYLGNLNGQQEVLLTLSCYWVLLSLAPPSLQYKWLIVGVSSPCQTRYILHLSCHLSQYLPS